MFMPDKPEPMPGDTVDRLHLFHDSERCIGCYSCELHCKMKNNLPIGRGFANNEIGPRSAITR